MGLKPRAALEEDALVPTPGRHTEWEVLRKGDDVAIAFYDERTRDLAFYTGPFGGALHVRRYKNDFNVARPAVIRFRTEMLASGYGQVARGYGKAVWDEPPDFAAPWDATPKKPARRPSRTTVAELVESFRALETSLRDLGCAAALEPVSAAPPPEGRALAPVEVLEGTPSAYREFVAAVGYRHFRFGPGRGDSLAWLPPGWARHYTRVIGDPAHPYDRVRALRNEGTYQYQYVVFAISDVVEHDGFCFGPSEKDGVTVVMTVDESLPDRELGLFEDWMRKRLAALGQRIAGWSGEDVRSLRAYLSQAGPLVLC